MEFFKAGAEIFVPDGLEPEKAIVRGRYLAIGAHQDDLEIMALHGILQGYGVQPSFVGVTCTDGAGSARTGQYESLSDQQMQCVRRQEQRAAAVVGRYAAQIQLDFSSAEVKQVNAEALERDLQAIIRAVRPEVIYTHNPMDKHDTHVAVAISVLRALRGLSLEDRPSRFYGCEVWRGLDWMQDQEKVALDVSGRSSLESALLGVFDSQIAGGKRYDLATIGRRRANATYFESHAVDQYDELTFALDLMPLLIDDQLDLIEYCCGFIEHLAQDVKARLSRKLGGA